MPRYIALLRGINVGGHHIIKMADLRNMFTNAGAKDVATYIQSGNVVFSHARAASTLVGHLEKHIEKAAGFKVPVILRTADEWQALVDANPFPAEWVYVFFLGAVTPVTVKAAAPERYEVIGRDVYVYLPDGVGRSKLAGLLGKALPNATNRNWRTVLQLHAMASQ